MRQRLRQVLVDYGAVFADSLTATLERSSSGATRMGAWRHAGLTALPFGSFLASFSSAKQQQQPSGALSVSV
jgi:hypothetical protein